MKDETRAEPRKGHAAPPPKARPRRRRRGPSSELPKR